MDSAVAGAADIGRYGRRIVRMIWDPEPTNDPIANRPAWCLGYEYTLETNITSKTKGEDSKLSTATSSDQQRPPAQANKVPQMPSAQLPTEAAATALSGNTTPPTPEAALEPTKITSQPAAIDTPPDSVDSSFDSSMAYDDVPDDGGWPPAFLNDFESRIWMTYRSGFEPIPRSTDPTASSRMSFAMRLKTMADQQAGFTTDSGWGCMIRTGQSLLANSLLTCRLGRSWRRGQAPDEERKLLSLFADDPRAPYSIHNFVAHGAAKCGKYPGEWFGPSATARCIHALANATENSFRVYSTGDLPDVYEDSFMEVAKPDGKTFHPTLILISTRLGIDKINQVYWESLTATLQLPQSVGIAGGRPSSSHYFVGAQRSDEDQGSYLFYLDPHHTRPALPFHEDPQLYTPSDVDSCHTRRLRRLHIREMDPSMLIGFLILDEENWHAWKSSVKHVQGKSIITVSEHDPSKGSASGRPSAIDEVETLSDDDGDTVLDG
ncbi:cysteine protease ATG4 [Pyricularia oryzae 70-15]|uniref:Cysteine protease ATG4 n=1 Tax=Pyricularia oryzae (strain 70-15 / ATCC MYA-4617 / FGSC 8958) TaxID=242507 RepID=ATG4_PYRO7|nr:cysteine protease ATG4 [Pyricularia oryzae 70-15]Q523C3.2 RecName: Full=Cysteine protease ATG4; AltName: Full=Autophagy-related protein 4 [Pyricularia oryzae 70-15]EHA50011.1 cysteine protease ATG4 [Pyricularia oryzae 70-15]